MTQRWRKAGSNPRSRLYERVCRVLPKGVPERPPGSRIKLRSSRETAMATGVRSTAIPFHGGTEISKALHQFGVTPELLILLGELREPPDAAGHRVPRRVVAAHD